MVLTRIFKIFFSLEAATLLFFTLRGENSLGGRSYLQMEYSGGKDREYLHRIIRQISQIARKSKQKRPRFRTEFRINAKQWHVSTRKQQLIVSVPGCSGEWKKSFAARHILYGIILRTQFNFDNPADPSTALLPVWLAGGIDEVISGKDGAEQLFSGNKDYSALRMIFKHQQRLPDFGALCRFSTLPEDPATATVFRQMARLLIEVATEMKLLDKMVKYHVEKRPADFWLNHFSTAKEAQLQLTDNARKFLWGRRSSTPEPIDPEVLKRLQTIVVPELDDAGVPSGKMLELSFADANRLFFTGKRPDLEEVRKFYRKEWIVFSFLRSAKVRDLAEQLSRISGQIGENLETADEFQTVFKQLTEQLEWEQLLFRTFIKLSFRHLPADQLYFWQSAARLSGSRAAGIGAAGEFLEKTEKEYFKNY